MSIYISGSLAFDRIMTFPGNFKDHILMDKLHMLNVSFMVDSMDERRGGCAGNIAFTLALLGEKPIIVSSAGRDFEAYAKNLKELGLPLEGITIYEDLYTALCYITTDINSNQITGFYPGAMSRPCEYKFPHLNPETDFAVISPGNVEDMRRLPKFYKKKGIRYIFDPGQQLPVLSGADLQEAIEGSYALITNDYELNMICNKTGLAENDILGRTLWIITTLGAEGALVKGVDGTQIKIPAYPVKNVIDPTGAGDAQRGGLLKGLQLGLTMHDAAKLGSISASFTIESLGTQERRFTKEEFGNRYKQLYNEECPIKL